MTNCVGTRLGDGRETRHLMKIRGNYQAIFTTLETVSLLKGPSRPCFLKSEILTNSPGVTVTHDLKRR